MKTADLQWNLLCVISAALLLYDSTLAVCFSLSDRTLRCSALWASVDVLPVWSSNVWSACLTGSTLEFGPAEIR